MVRPLPEGGNWGFALVNGHKIVPGIMVRVALLSGPAEGSLPHGTKDQRVSLAGIKVLDRNVPSWLDEGAPPSSRTLAGAFEGHVTHNSE